MAFQANPFLPLWTIASITDHFHTKLDPIFAQHNTAFKFEGEHVADWLDKPRRVELGIIGPDLQQVSNNSYDMLLKVRLLLSVTKGDPDAYIIHLLGGYCMQACTDIMVYSHRTDNPALWKFCLSVDTTRDRAVKYHYFGEMSDKETQQLQAGVHAFYVKEDYSE